jgi:hypothetical protein
MRNIDILEGSLYDCDYDRSNLPAYDKAKTIYECGSNIFNVLYYIWLGIITAISMTLLMLWNYRKEFTKLILKPLIAFCLFFLISCRVLSGIVKSM